jgi:hypothetical protein
MALSPNYGWAEPDNSSLVKNGAQDIRALGDAIDTSLWNVGFGQAGKNKIINGDFAINQRAFTSISSATMNSYCFDRWLANGAGGTFAISSQAFTAGAAPVAGYEAATFLRGASSGQSAAGDYSVFQERIEDVRTFAGQTVTISFWAKASTGTPKIGVAMTQDFGTGGSPSAAVSTPVSGITISTAWVRYSATFAVPSISGKTVGTTTNGFLGLELWLSAGSTFNTRASSIGIQNNTIDVWGVQVEYGSKATPFETASGTIQGELALCQRYYYQAATGNTVILGGGFCLGTTELQAPIMFPVTMRTAPSLVIVTGSNYYTDQFNGKLANTLTLQRASQQTAALVMAATGFVSGTGSYIYTNNASASVGFNSEL